MRCPRDGSELGTQIYEADIEVDACSKCSGVFLDQGELERIQRTVEKDHRRELDEPVDTVTEGFEAARNETLGQIACPKCGQAMERHRYGLGSQTVIDECSACGGLWLDGGELQELERFYERSQEEVRIPLTFRIWAAVQRVRKGKR